MSNSFVSGLWGDAVQLARPGIKPYKVFDDIRGAVTWKHKAEPRVVYAYGEANATFLRNCGLSPIVLNSQAVPNYTGETERNPNVVGSFAYGASVWRAKIEMIAEALKTNDAVLWLDWDVLPIAEIPADFWGRMAEGPPYQGALRQLHRPQCGWRKADRRKLHHGGFVYVRGREMGDRLLRLCIERPDLNDELIYGLLVDELMGGEWLGWEKYREMGFEPDCYDVARGACFPKSDALFRNMGK